MMCSFLSLMSCTFLERRRACMVSKNRANACGEILEWLKDIGETFSKAFSDADCKGDPERLSIKRSVLVASSTGVSTFRIPFQPECLVPSARAIWALQPRSLVYKDIYTVLDGIQDIRN